METNEYVYLIVGAVGLMWSVTTTRVYVGHNMLETANASLRTSYELARSGVGSDLARLACRKFEKSAFSPPEPDFTIAQNEYDIACNWLRLFSQRIPKTAPADETGFAEVMADFRGHAMSSNVSVQQIYDLAEGRMKSVASVYEVRAAVQPDAEASMSERAWNALAPFLLALAVALRLTKVTGEIREEKWSNARMS